MILYALAVIVASLGFGYAIRPLSLSLPPVVVREPEPEGWAVAVA